MTTDGLKKEFSDLFGPSNKEIFVFFAPGRVNLIGEHTDYNDGWVLPCALDMGTYLVCRKNDLGILRFRAADFDETIDLEISKNYSSAGSYWYHYPLGVIDQVSGIHGELPSGLDLHFKGDLPVGAGLSSSASVEMVTAVAVNDMFHLDIPKKELVELARKAENQFVGVSCGVMDQFSVGFGKKDHATLLDCRSLDFESIPLNMEDHRLVIVNTCVPRRLSSSLYNQRVDECNRAMEELRKTFPKARALRDISHDSLNDLEDLIEDATLRKRARHVISENKRVLDSAKALKRSELNDFGLMMQASHRSLKEDYEVTGRELDILAENASSHPACLGARMTGAGFGGCTVNIVQSELVKDFEFSLSDKYEKLTGIRPEFYYPAVDNGARRIE